MDIFLLLKIVALIESIGVCLYAFKKLDNQNMAIIFSIMIFLFFLSVALFFPQGNINEWARAIPFFAAQFILYLVATEFVQMQSDSSQSTTNSSVELFIFGIPQSYFGISDWFDYLTRQGFQYILSLPLAILVTAYILIRLPYLSDVRIRNTLLVSIMGLGLLTFNQLVVFVVKSQQLLPIFNGLPLYIFEFVCFYIAIGFFGIGIYLLPTIKNKPNQAA